MNQERQYFAAANTSKGFISYFPQIFGGDDRLYILKGGPGTGKSYFLKTIAAHAERQGLTVERYLCSSDPDSLDGVRILEKGIAVLDGTAPHVWEPELPGAREEILNLGQFWQQDRLYAKRHTIAELAQQKKKNYQSALQALSVVGKLAEYRFALVRSYIQKEKMERAAVGLVKKLEGKGRTVIRPQTTYGMKGKREACNGWERARVKRFHEPLYGVGYEYLKRVLELGKEKGLAMEYAPHPLFPDYPEAIYFAKDDVLLSCGGQGEGKKVGCRRFLNGNIAKEKGSVLRFWMRAEERMVAQALEGFEKMKENHFALEALYGEAMDFAAKEIYCQKEIEKIFKNF